MKIYCRRELRETEGNKKKFEKVTLISLFCSTLDPSPSPPLPHLGVYDVQGGPDLADHPRGVGPPLPLPPPHLGVYEVQGGPYLANHPLGVGLPQPALRDVAGEVTQRSVLKNKAYSVQKLNIFQSYPNRIKYLVS